MKLLSISLLSLLFLTTPLSAETVRRAALDIGSAFTKLQVADVDLEENRIVNVLMTKTVNIGFSQDLAEQKNGTFSETVQNQALKVLKELKAEAEQYKPKSYRGVATAAFRNAKNSDQLVKRLDKELDMQIFVIDQQEEGSLGFLTAIALSGANPETTVTWDTGGGSFQITGLCNNQHVSLLGNLGMTSIKNAIIQEIQGKDPKATFSPNPVSGDEAAHAIHYVATKIEEIPSCLLEKLQDPKTTVIDLHTPAILPESPTYNYEQILTLVGDRLGLTDTAIQQRTGIDAADTRTLSESVSYPLLVLGIMKHLNIKEATSVVAPGNMAGVLISKKYWTLGVPVAS